MNGFAKASLLFVGMIFTYDLMKRRFAIKHAEKLNDQRNVQLKLTQDLINTGMFVPKSDIEVGNLFVADQHPTKE